MNSNNESTNQNESDRLFCALGRVVVSFQLLELWVAEALSKSLGLLEVNDRHLVSSAMSYRQKVDLLIELYVRHGQPNQGASLDVTKQALLSAEEFRNRVVHSVWAIRESKNWVRTKSNLRGKNGFEVKTKAAQVSLLEEASNAMNNIRDWEFCDQEMLTSATQVFLTLEINA